ncbi:Blp family class II bacteriocin [Streptococcus mutans]|uniref:Blp family class II bacteriocin n=1 Tax=Streptococcus mutans TaxID=1309 RepID=UPI0002B5D6A1|nr:Blp family class II bacteriocin [Streptococcus mutans]EMB62652.1 pore-forming peptide, putative bacteriocin [Streptococcus mutans 1SM1]EMC00454.1 pore-forming peptide, putative bacteriocin [Streptococcus mutans NFSM1]MDT9500736.1 Blp family class II bacteriocin [Streptococcus mutans]NLQ89630.1 ComC/BlpC family peptide pheromone/bacteriocin [Streptococcus mutans]NLQ91204.1 ComC/BlpC family peptide pheromone/bacteriocin [Streptococcus mutans]
MNTHILEQFDVMDNEALSTVEGGGCSWKGAAKATVAGGIGGAFAGDVTVPIVGTVPGWAAGAGLGAAGYGATCWW